MKAIALFRIDFDNMENHSPRTKTLVKIFTPERGLSAQGMMARWFSQQSPEKLYTGYDNQVYPQWKVEVER